MGGSVRPCYMEVSYIKDGINEDREDLSNLFMKIIY